MPRQAGLFKPTGNVRNAALFASSNSVNGNDHAENRNPSAASDKFVTSRRVTLEVAKRVAGWARAGAHDCEDRSARECLQQAMRSALLAVEILSAAERRLAVRHG